MPIEKCGNCAFGVKEWLHYGYRIDCHRRAPQSFTVYKGHYDGAQQYGPGSYWPEVKDADFCGDWELQDAKDV